MDPKLVEKRRKSAAQQRKKRRQTHLRRQLHNVQRTEKTISVWRSTVDQDQWGTIDDGDWVPAVQLSVFFEVRDIGRGNSKGREVWGAIGKISDNDDLVIIEKKYCRGNEQCLARQGGHAGARSFGATLLLIIEDKVLVQWQDRAGSEWLPVNQVDDAPIGRLRRSGCLTTRANKAASILQLNQIFSVLRPGSYVGKTNEFVGRANVHLPFSDFLGFLEIINKKDEVTVRKTCRTCSNQPRRKGGLCNRCYKLSQEKDKDEE